MTTQTIGLIGAGNMARSLAGGLIQNGWDKQLLILSDPDDDQRHAVEHSLQVKTYSDNKEVIKHADIVVLAVKPQAMEQVLADIAIVLGDKDDKPLLISVVAGVRIAALSRQLGQNLAIVRAMPNTAALVGSSATALFANAQVSKKQHNIAESILRSVGITVWLDKEELMDTVTALSGSGPAYFFLVMEALEQAAINKGLDADTARILTLETAFGAAKMALEGHEDPASLRKQVTSPGGTTEAAIRVFYDANLYEIFEQALTAAKTRSEELAHLFTGGK